MPEGSHAASPREATVITMRPTERDTRDRAQAWLRNAMIALAVVRRRLFEDPSGAARTDIAAVARRFTQFYAEHRREFPPASPRPSTSGGSATATRCTPNCSTACMTTGRRWSGSSAPAGFCG
jgi:hypothetical protein